MASRRRLILIGVLLGAPLLLAAILAIYLNFADLSGWRDTVAKLASDAIGRELRINGEFQPEIGFTTRVVATDITLANPDWSDDPHMVAVDRLDASINLLSIISGPITIRDVVITGARVLFEVGENGEFNWDFRPGEPKGPPGPDVELVITDAVVESARLVYATPEKEPLQAELEQLEFTDDGTGMLDLDLGGSLMDQPIEISGRLGTFIGLINANAVEHDLTGRFAGTEFSTKGTIDSLSALSGVAGTASVSGSEFSRITETFGLDPIVEGPFSVEASVKPSGAGSDVDLDVSAGGMKAHLAGIVDSLTGPRRIDVTVTASGPDIRGFGKLTGITELPEEEFSVSGGIRWNGFPIHFKEVDIAVGENTLSANGVLGAPPQMLGTDFAIEGGGPNVSSIGALVGIRLPRGSFAVRGRVVRVEGGLQVDAMEANIGRTTLEAEGKVGDPPSYEGTTLKLHAEGPNIAHFNDLIGVDLPAESFAIDGRLSEGDRAIILEGVRAQLGRSRLQVDGTLKTENNLVGTALKIMAEGPDADQIGDLVGVSGVPPEAWSVDGGLEVLDSGYRLGDVAASLGSLAIRAHGRVITSSGLVGTDLQIHAEDTSISHPASIAGITGLPHDPLTVDTRLRVEDAGYRLDGFKSTVGDVELETDGLIGVPPELDGTRMHIAAHGPNLSSLNQYLEQTGLPSAPFSVSGDIHVTDEAFALDGVVAEVNRNRVTLNGTVQPVHGLVGTDLVIDATTPDLRAAGALATGFTDIPELPAEPLTMTTRLVIDEHGYQINNLEGSLSRAKLSVDGRIGLPPDFLGTDLAIDGDGPDASLFKAVTGVTIPVAPFSVHGRLRRSRAGFAFHAVSLQLAEYQARINGTLGKPPRFEGTNLEIEASGPDTTLIRELGGLDRLPNDVWKASGRFQGTPERFTAEDLVLHMGASDLRGSFEVDIRAKPVLSARLRSSLLDLSSYLKPLPELEDEEPESEAAAQKTNTDPVIPREPIDFSALKKIDGDLEIEIGALHFPLKQFRNIEFAARLERGRLEVEKFNMAGQREGRGSIRLVLEPVDDAYRFDTVLDFDALRLDVPGDSVVDPGTQPPFDLDVQLEATGRSPHEMAVSSDGFVQLIIGKGKMDNSVLEFVTADILVTLLKAFNPFAKDEAATELQCGVALLSVENGLATLEPMAIQSDKMTMLGHGQADLDTEKLDFEWITKPRKGIGISASMLTNPYIKVGGTLRKPAVQLKGVEAVASTGVAVATMGLSLVAKGMFDRVTAEKKVCKKALEEIGQLTGFSPDKPQKKK